MSADNRFAPESGFSLVEILITIAIVGIAFTAILGGMMVMITTSSYQRKAATADTLARDAAEQIKNNAANAYVSCAGIGTYSLPTAPTAYSITITKIEYWNGAAPSGTAYSPTFQLSPCPSPDHGLQRITITAASSDVQASETVQVIKRVAP